MTPAPLRILVAHNVSRSRTGGMSRLMGRVHDCLAEDGHTVDYFCAEDVPARLRGRVARLTFPLLVWRHAARRARAGRPYDVVNVHEPAGAAIAALKRAAGMPRVVVMSYGVERRGWAIACEERRLGRSDMRRHTRVTYPVTTLWQARVALTHADHVLCSSREDADFLERVVGVPGARVTAIQPGADPCYASLAGVRDYSDGHRLLFFGTWLRRKGVLDLVEAFGVLASRHPRLTLTILGGGFPSDVVRAAFPAALRGRVACPDVTAEAPILEVLTRTDINILPSLFEGTPLTLIETMMSGMPCVTTATCGMKDVVEHDRTGLLVPTRAPAAIVAAVERLIGDADLRARLGRAAHRYATERHAWRTVAGVVHDVYRAERAA